MKGLISRLIALTTVALSATSVQALPGEVLYLEADTLSIHDRFLQGADAFARVANQRGPLAAFAAVREAACIALHGDGNAALQKFDAVLREEGSGPWRSMAQAEKAKVLFALEQYAQAAAAVSGAIAGLAPAWWHGSYQWLAAEAQMNTSPVLASGEAYFSDVVSATIFKKRRLDASVLLAHSSKTSHRLLAAMGMLRSGKSNRSRDLLRELVNGSEPNTAEGYVAPLRLRAIADALDAVQRDPLKLAALSVENFDSPWASLALTYAVQRLLKQNETAQVEGLLKLLAAEPRNGHRVAELQWRLARALEDKGRLDDALALYRELARKQPSYGRAPSAFMRAARMLQSREKGRQALELYEELATTAPDQPLAVEALYRAALLLRNLGEPEKAQTHFAAAARRGFGNFFGHLAEAQLEPAETGTVPIYVRKVHEAAPFFRVVRRHPDPPARSKIERGDPNFQRLDFFGLHGLVEAEWEVAYLDKHWPPKQGRDALYAAMGAAGAAYTAMQWANDREWGLSPEGEIDGKRWRVRYPRPYWNVVLGLARETGLDPYLILAMARKESTFRPALVSHAGAGGVMQVMPRTARWLAKVDPDVDPRHAAEPFRPANSLQLGAHYFQRMLERSKGNWVYALASYNAGPGNFDKWRKKTPTADMQIFIEKIPFPETQDYVRGVLGAYAAYRSLYDSSPR